MPCQFVASMLSIASTMDVSDCKTGRMEGPESVCEPGLQDSTSAERVVTLCTHRIP